MSFADRMKATETSVRAMAARMDQVQMEHQAESISVNLKLATLEQRMATLEFRQDVSEHSMAQLTRALLEDDEPAPEGKALDGTPTGGERDETQPL